MIEKLKVVFCGTPDFSLPTLEELFFNVNIDLCGVITMPDRPFGRGQELKTPPVGEFAKKKNIPLFQVENINREPEILAILESLNLDFILVLAFAQFLGPRILNMPRLGCFNIHTSLLPKYRGAAPIQYALLNGERSTGVSIQKMVKEMDAGDLVHLDAIDIFPDETAEELASRLKIQAALSTKALVEKIIHHQLFFSPQDQSGISFAPTLKKEDGFLDFKNSSFEKIYNQIRALTPWPGTFCFLNEMRLKVFSIEKTNQKLLPGETSIQFGCLLVGLQDVTVRLLQIQLEGKKRGSDTELLNGFKNKNATILLNPG